MANDVTRFTHIIDTAHPTTLVYDGPIFIASVRWVSAGASAGDQAEVQDADGRTIWESAAPAANYVEQSAVAQVTMNGYKVPTLDSGKLYIRCFDYWERPILSVRV